MDDEIHMEEAEKENSPSPLQLVHAIKELKARSRGNCAKEPEEAEEQINQGNDDDETPDWKSVRVQLEQLCGEFGKQTGKHRSGIEHAFLKICSVVIVR
ncbi:unnamed protein product [Nippostrongylus brasiliensis]|uniref:Transposase n=1 Tax=Nippostrongylus brasiliensis TaxID=27835 RepID=A0A0N4YJK7_NIPBR|nr:unnamed protein product [Nippostrongylus brasiliensis]